MLFNSPEYGIFLFVVFFIFWGIQRHKTARTVFLTLASLFFYMCWNPKYVVLILASSVIDYIAGWYVYKSKHRKARRAWLAFSLIGNLGLLFTFKYYGFATSTIELVANWLGWQVKLPRLELVLPVGISFYTFQSMSYTLDIYFGKLEPTRSFIKFLMYVSFFPQLVAGPIVRARQFLWQIDSDLRLGADEASEAVVRIIVGLLKKVAISDYIAINLVDRVFEFPQPYSSLETLVAIYGYALQIYCDFSGYSDIAIGSARLLGFRLPENFDRPYISQNLREFWRRWHISLSTWLRDYLYIPLGGSRKGKLKTYRNLMITMLLGGLWHGANWTFVFWGAFHGVGLAATRWYQRCVGQKEVGSIKRLLLRLATFHFVCFGWVFFRSPTFSRAIEVLSRLGELSFDTVNLPSGVLIAILIGYSGHVIPERVFRKGVELFCRMPAYVQAALVFGAIWVATRMAGTELVPFIYFQF